MIHYVGKNRAYKTINSAIGCVNNGDTLLIDEGIYYEDIVMNDKAVNLIGNTLNPGNGEIVIETYEYMDIENINNRMLRMEGIYFRLRSSRYYDYYRLRVYNCSNLYLLFNKCILSTLYEEHNIFQADSSNSNLIISLLNSRLIWRRDEGYGSSGSDHFARNSQSIEFKINKCILAHEIESIDQEEMTLPTELDYVRDKEVYGYGPFYGESSKEIKDLYHFKGTVNNDYNVFSRVDNVTFDSVYKAQEINLSDNNLVATVNYEGSTNENYYNNRATVGVTEGKWYWEIERKDLIYNNLSRYGVGTEYLNFLTPLGGDNRAWGYEPGTGKFYYMNEVIYKSDTCGYNDVIGIALDSYNGKIWWSKNGVWLLDGNPSNGTNPIFEGLNYKLFPMVSLFCSYGYDSSAKIIFSKQDLNYSIPNGFEFYSTSLSYKVKCINVDTNKVTGFTYSDPVTNAYELITTDSGTHFLICEDSESSPDFNDLILGRFEPEAVVI